MLSNIEINILEILRRLIIQIYFSSVSFKHGTSKQIYNIIDRFGVSYCLRSCVFSLNMMGMRDYKLICTTRETRDMQNVHACHMKPPPPQ